VHEEAELFRAAVFFERIRKKFCFVGERTRSLQIAFLIGGFGLLYKFPNLVRGFLLLRSELTAANLLQVRGRLVQ